MGQLIVTAGVPAFTIAVTVRAMMGLLGAVLPTSLFTCLKVVVSAVFVKVTTA
jgi:hypothetical protein